MRRFFLGATVKQKLEDQLEDAQKDRVLHQAAFEEQGFHVMMLNARIARIQAELQAMPSTTNQGTTK